MLKGSHVAEKLMVVAIKEAQRAPHCSGVRRRRGGDAKGGDGAEKGRCPGLVLPAPGCWAGSRRVRAHRGSAPAACGELLGARDPGLTWPPADRLPERSREVWVPVGRVGQSGESGGGREVSAAEQGGGMSGWRGCWVDCTKDDQPASCPDSTALGFGAACWLVLLLGRARGALHACAFLRSTVT